MILIFNHENQVYRGTEKVPIINFTKLSEDLQVARTKFPITFDCHEPSTPLEKQAHTYFTGDYLYKAAEGFRHRVEVIVEDPETGFVLTGRGPRHGKWVYPGGGIDEGESVLEAAKREIAEETGLKVEPLEVLNKEPSVRFYTNPKNGYEGSATTYVRAKLLPGKSKRLGADNDVLLDLGFYPAQAVLDDERVSYAPPVIAPKDTPPKIFKQGHYFVGMDFSDMLTPPITKEGSSKVATVGQFLFNEGIPKEYQVWDKVITKKEVSKILQNVADTNPNLYNKVSKHMYDVGDASSTYDVRHLQYNDLKKPLDTTKYFTRANKLFEVAKKKMTEDAALVYAYSDMKTQLSKDLMEAGTKDENLFAIMATSGARGGLAPFTDMLSGPVLATDYKGKPIPIILDKSYADGLTPAQGFAASFGTRRGLISTKMATPEAGATGKYLASAEAPQVVTMRDCGTLSGIPYKTDDPYNIGKYHAATGNLITQEVIDDFIEKGIPTIICRSPLTCTADVGICSKCLGKTEVGDAPIGYAAGVNSSTAAVEPLTQAMLSEKHTGGAVKKKVGGYPLVKKLLEVPEVFEGEAILSEIHGKVSAVEKTDWGAWKVTVKDHQSGEPTDHFSPQDNPPIVKVGDTVEKGTALSEGVVNPARVTELRGYGEGRKVLSDELRTAYEEMGLGIDRSHYELAARSLINFADIHEPIGDALPGETVRLDTIRKSISFPDEEAVAVKSLPAYNVYLARQYLEYSPGSEFTEKIRKDLLDNKISTILVTKEKPKFLPIMVRLQDVPKHDPDWVQRLGNQGLKDNLIRGVLRGDKSDTTGYNFIHPLVYGQTFGKVQGKY